MKYSTKARGSDDEHNIGEVSQNILIVQSAFLGADGKVIYWRIMGKLPPEPKPFTSQAKVGLRNLGILRLHSQGYSLRAIGRLAGITSETVRKVLKGDRRTARLNTRVGLRLAQLIETELGKDEESAAVNSIIAALILERTPANEIL